MILPVEIVYLIFEYTDPVTLLSCERVCRQFRQIIKVRLQWNYTVLICKNNIKLWKISASRHVSSDTKKIEDIMNQTSWKMSLISKQKERDALFLPNPGKFKRVDTKFSEKRDIKSIIMLDTPQSEDVIAITNFSDPDTYHVSFHNGLTSSLILKSIGTSNLLLLLLIFRQHTSRHYFLFWYTWLCVNNWLFTKSWNSKSQPWI